MSSLSVYKDLYNLDSNEVIEVLSKFLTQQTGKKVNIVFNGEKLNEIIDNDIKLFFNALSRRDLSEKMEELKKMFLEASRQKEYNIFINQIGKIIRCKIISVSKNKTILKINDFYNGEANEINEQHITGSFQYYLLDKVFLRQDEKIGLIFVRDSGDSTKFIRAILNEVMKDIDLEFVAIARIPGYQTKIIVKNKNKDEEYFENSAQIAKGYYLNRINLIKNYLGDFEKINFIPFELDLAQQIKACMPKFSINTIIFCENNIIEVIINNDEFLAKILGPEGKNISLISKIINQRNKYLNKEGYFKIQILTQSQFEKKRKEEENEKIKFYHEEYEIEEKQAAILIKLENKINPLTCDSLSEDTKKKYMEYLSNVKENEKEEFIKQGGKEELFLYKNLKTEVYFNLLKYNIRSIEDLLKYDPLSLQDKTNLDINTCVYLLSEEI